MKNQIHLYQYFYWIVLLLLASSVLTAGYHYFNSQKNNDLFLAFEMLLGLLVTIAPLFISRWFKVYVPNLLFFLYLIFILASIYLGTFWGFYGKFYYWDKILHISSAILLGGLGLTIYGSIIKEEARKQISPWFVAIFVFCFGLAMGVFWEFYEYTFDGLLGLNMQRFTTSSGVLLKGRVALLDTMGDLFIDALGSALIAIYAFFSLRKNIRWITQFLFQKRS